MSKISLLKKNKGAGILDHVKALLASTSDLPKVQFVPLSVPLQRRLQTVGCVFYFSLWLEAHVIMGLLATQFLLWPFIFAYFVFMYYDNKYEMGGHWSEWARNHVVWRWLAAYFPAQVVKECDLDPTEKYLFACHPHGIYATGTFLAFGSEALGISNLYPGIRTRILTLNANFYFPLYREVVYALGCCSPSKKSINNIFNRGDSIAVVVGGAQESLMAKPRTADLFLTKRKGFIAMAIKNGASVVPVYSFGENELFDQVSAEPGSPVDRFQCFLKKHCGFTLPMYYGRNAFAYNYGLLPRRHPVTTVIGSPIPTEKCETPSPEVVEEIHQQYMKSLKELYDRNKEKYTEGDIIPEMRFY